VAATAGGAAAGGSGFGGGVAGGEGSLVTGPATAGGDVVVWTDEGTAAAAANRSSSVWLGFGQTIRTRAMATATKAPTTPQPLLPAPGENIDELTGKEKRAQEADDDEFQDGRG